MKKAYYIIATILIVFFASYYFYNEFIVKEKNLSPDTEETLAVDKIIPKDISPPQVKDDIKEDEEISLFLDSIGTVTSINFSGSEKIDFEWFLDDEGGKVELSGEKISANILVIEASKIDNYFLASGFIMDKNNLADGTVSSLVGYIKDQTVCLVYNRGEYEEFTMPTETTTTAIEINCGTLDAGSMARVTKTREDAQSEKIYKNDKAGISFKYPKEWYTSDDGESVAIQTHEGTFDKGNRPIGFELFWVFYNTREMNIDSIKKNEDELNTNIFQYSNVAMENINVDGATIRLYTFFDNDCGKSARAFWENKNVKQQAFYGRSCGQQLSDENLIIFKDIISSISLF